MTEHTTMKRFLSMRGRKAILLGVLAAVIIGGGFWWWMWHRGPQFVYTSEGYGGYVPAESLRKPKNDDPVAPAVEAYNKGNYREAEAEAERVIRRREKSDSPKVQSDAARAQYVLAFSAAGRKDMELARERFADLKKQASKLPDKGKMDLGPGQATQTLEEQGAYQHAVCTAALGDKKAAEAEYLRFMRDYPESPLVNGAILRIERLNGGHLPDYAEKAWHEAQKVAHDREKARRMEQAMCGPECLAEILRRRGEKVDVRTLAKEMDTTEQGTTLQGLADAAEKRGYSAKGLSLTWKGLKKQPCPLIALVMPGHYVVVNHVGWRSVSVWDPSPAGTGKPATRAYSHKEWTTIWQGIALTLEPKSRHVERD